MDKGYTSSTWMTFKQALELRAHVRKGEQSSLVVYADKIIRTDTDAATGEASEYAIPFMKGYNVFNIEQIEGLPERFYTKPEPRTGSIQRIARAETFLSATGANAPPVNIEITESQTLPTHEIFDVSAQYRWLGERPSGRSISSSPVAIRMSSCEAQRRADAPLCCHADAACTCPGTSERQRHT
jgi:hypothetical protein